MVCDMGAYLSAFAPYIPYVGAVMLPGVYDFPTCFIRITAAFTNTLPVDAYRGAGRPEAAYLIERLVDVAAHELGIAPDALRRKNFIRPKAMPYTTPTGKVYDSGEFAAHLATRPGDHRLEGLSPPCRAIEKGPQAARHRACDLYRGLRQQRPRCRDGTDEQGRQCHGAGRIAIDRAGAQDRLRAARRRASRSAAQPHHRDPGRYRFDRDRRRHRRLELDHLRRRFGGERGAQARGQSQGAGGQRARSGGGRTSRSRTGRSASPAPIAPSPSPSSRLRGRRRPRFFPSAIPSGRRSRPIPTAPTSPRSRSTPRPGTPTSSTTSWSTISA